MSFDYCSIDDVYAVASEAEGQDRANLLKLAQDLERGGQGVYGGKVYIIVYSSYGAEVRDLQSYMECGA